MQKVYGVRREGDKNIYYFLPSEELCMGDKVVVQFEDFQTVATVVKCYEEKDDTKAYELQKILRKATEKDIKIYNELDLKAKQFLPQIKKKSLELGLMMKFVSAQYSLDNSKILIVFSSEERVDFRQLLKDIASMLKVRIELKQIGQRDEVKVCGGVGPCGEPCCCARFLKDFEHVTVKMAKIQGLSLSPTKINGICGRLMCCLGYETQTYEEVLAKMPKLGSEVVTPNGTGTASYNDILRERVSVRRQEGDTFVVEDFDLDEIIFGDKIKEYNAHPERFNLKRKEKAHQEASAEKETHSNDIEKEKQNNQSTIDVKKPDFERKDNNRFEKNNKFENKKGWKDKKDNHKKPFNDNGNNKAPQKYGITFETAEEAQAEHEVEQKKAETKNFSKDGNNSNTKPFNKSYNGKGRHHRFSPKNKNKA